MALMAFSSVVFQQYQLKQKRSKIGALKNELRMTSSQLDEATGDLRRVRQELTNQKQRADQQQLEIERAAAQNK